MSLLGNSGLSAADLAAVVGNNDGFGNGGDGWLFLLFILLLWGNNGNGWGNQNQGYPAVQQGFDQAAIINGIQGVQNSVTNGQFEMMSSLQNCCCENRLATANLGATVASEACATRQAFNDGLRDMMVQDTANTQAIVNAINNGNTGLMNKICQLEMDAKNDKIADLQRQVEEAQDNARYNGLIAAFNQSQENQTTQLERYLAPQPVPAYVVQNPNGCNCGTCGCAV